MTKFYLTFGQGHAHAVGGFTWDKDVICEIVAPTYEDARERAMSAFGRTWSMLYYAEELPDLAPYFHRGIHALGA